MNNNKISKISNKSRKVERHEPVSSKADDYVAKGIALYMVGLLDDAILNYKKAIELDIQSGPF